MAEKVIYSDVLIAGSITNPDVESNDAIDNNSPLSFFDFLKQTSAIYTPAEYNSFYTSYLNKWTIAKNSVVATTDFIAEQYSELLKDISLNFTTVAEKRFLSQIDFTDPDNLDIILPFYTKKIKEIILFYKQKRDTGTFVIERNKIKGTGTSIERAIYEIITQYIFSDDSIENFSLINYNVDLIKRNLEVNIDEFVDVYSNYFDLPRIATDEDALRTELYTFNTNSIEADLFFDLNNEITKQIFGTSVFLKEIPLAVNTSITFNPVCSPTNPLQSLVEDDNRDLLGASNRADLKKRLYEKYLGTDFYYLSTNALTESISGVFITAENPSGNLLNLQTADIAGVESNNIEALRSIGLFFKPDKQGILKVNAKTFKYTIDTSVLQPDSVYIFPNPNVYGNVSLNSQTDYPLLYTFDITSQVKGKTSGVACGDPKISKDEQPTLPYFSRQQNASKFESEQLYGEFSDLYNEGIIQKWQTDIYGNQYAIFKDKLGQYFINEVVYGDQFVKCLTLDGHLFFDPVEGYNFNYSTEDTDGTTIRTGLTSHTVNYDDAPTFTMSGSPLWLNFRQFYPYQECGFNELSGNSNLKYAPWYDCGAFTKDDNSALPDSVYADLSSWPIGYYYYDLFLAAGFGSMTPPNRALTNVQSLTADFYLTVQNLLSSGDAISYTGGLFTDDIQLSDSDNNNLFIDEVDANAVTVLSTLTGSDLYRPISYYASITGVPFIRKVGSTTSTRLSSALSAVTTKYNAYIERQLNDHLIDFDVIYDSIFLRSPDVLVIDKLVFDGYSYTVPATRNTFFVTDSANPCNQISNCFFDEENNHVTFMIMTEFPFMSGSNSKILYPCIYRYYIGNNKTKKLWPLNTNTDVSAVSAYYSIPEPTDTFTPGMSAYIAAISPPKIAYNSKNGVWKLTYVGKDLNNFPHIFDYELKEINSTFTTLSSRLYTLTNKIAATTNWSSPSAQYINFGVSVNITINSQGIS